jgi:hypothetical protein
MTKRRTKGDWVKVLVSLPGNDKLPHSKNMEYKKLSAPERITIEKEVKKLKEAALMEERKKKKEEEEKKKPKSTNFDALMTEIKTDEEDETGGGVEESKEIEAEEDPDEFSPKVIKEVTDSVRKFYEMGEITKSKLDEMVDEIESAAKNKEKGKVLASFENFFNLVSEAYGMDEGDEVNEVIDQAYYDFTRSKEDDIKQSNVSEDEEELEDEKEREEEVVDKKEVVDKNKKKVEIKVKGKISAKGRLFGNSADKSVKSDALSETTWGMDSIVSDITNFDMDDFDIDLSDCDYQGFDPRATIGILAKHAEDSKTEIPDFIKEMKFLSTLVVLRGTNNVSLVDKSSDTVKGIISDLLKKYKVVSGNEKGSKKNIPKDAIILSRILSCFPMFASASLAKGIIAPKCKSDSLPDYLHHSAAPSLIPSDDNALYTKWLDWSKEHDKLINGKEANSDNCDFFGKIAWKSTILSDSERSDKLRSLSNAESKRKEDESSK